MNSILKGDRNKRQGSSSARVVSWSVPDEKQPAHTTVPSSGTKPKDLKDLYCLRECVQVITQWKEQVECVREVKSNAESNSLEQCRKLILEWAEDLRNADTVDLRRSTLWERTEEEEEEEEEGSQTESWVMEWARELHTMTERCGVRRDEFAEILVNLRKKKKLLILLPFLQFITWILLRKQSKETVMRLWLSTKQRTWRTDTPKYIPHSVWEWIRSASVEVTLDPMTNHPWLQLSEDCKKVQESLSETEVTFSTQRFDSWPCVLGSEGFSSGRHYWEVDLANNGYWKLGVTTATSKRHGRFPMKPSGGYWVIWRSTRQFFACTKQDTPLPLSLVPRKVGVYLDYEEGQISFYNAEKHEHIYTFTGSFQETLYPLFAPLDGRTLITISSPKTPSQADVDD
ncbi:E3 ubiquitin-protein ligase TRIM39-like [Chanos chanos]|uniref:E3 ubiquitin-protein ligase TRIM39-like n=1 Tax=Chanos chanos TaxID=29144 RepID=A0A6J2WWS8_CHACN|nr:E3 ubiquitin-protein ligase TRIM39-like [Chanos chanos]